MGGFEVERRLLGEGGRGAEEVVGCQGGETADLGEAVEGRFEECLSTSGWPSPHTISSGGEDG